MVEKLERRNDLNARGVFRRQPCASLRRRVVLEERREVVLNVVRGRQKIYEVHRNMRSYRTVWHPGSLQPSADAVGQADDASSALVSA